MLHSLIFIPVKLELFVKTLARKYIPVVGVGPSGHSPGIPDRKGRTKNHSDVSLTRQVFLNPLSPGRKIVSRRQTACREQP